MPPLERALCHHHILPSRCTSMEMAAALMEARAMTAAKLFDLTGKVALVTGASSGLGARFAEMLAENGAAVALLARRTDRLAAVQARIEAAGGRAVAIAGDVLERGAMLRAFDTAEKTFGTVDILVNNAGVVHAGRAVELTEEEWRRVVGTDLDAVLFWSREAARRLLAGKAMRVNAIAPGRLATVLNREYLASERGAAIKREIPLGRFGEERDLDGVLLLLASDAGRFMTGATVVVDGGQLVAVRG